MKNIILTALVCCLGMQVFSQSAKPAEAPRKKMTMPEVVLQIVQNMVRIDGGTFKMGCQNESDSDCYYWEKPAHKVSVSSFYMDKYPITQLEWEAVMGTRPWFSKNCPTCPVENVNWNDATEFLARLNKVSGVHYRLPTEAEFEFAARGGNLSKGYKYAGSDNIREVAWYDSISRGQAHPVAQKKPNELGLYDMSGNVFQWTLDWFDSDYYLHSPEKDPKGPDSESYRTCRGGSWWSDDSYSRVSNRDRYPVDARDDDVGFRIAKDANMVEEASSAGQ